jgi:hypothetical protein
MGKQFLTGSWEDTGNRALCTVPRKMECMVCYTARSRQVQYGLLTCALMAWHERSREEGEP